jgi:hypothetical protein
MPRSTQVSSLLISEKEKPKNTPSKLNPFHGKVTRIPSGFGPNTLQFWITKAMVLKKSSN